MHDISKLLKDIPKLPPEIEKGNIEYKRILHNIDDDRFNHLVSQMSWRLEEGNGIAYYFIGVDDDGTFYGLKSKELKISKKILEAVAKKCNSNIKLVDILNDKIGLVAKYMITVNNEIKDLGEIKIAFIGNTKAGKSTLISVLAHGDLDNGFGISRINMFNHKHEIHSGLTSSISVEVIGFDKKGILNYESYPNITLEDICKKSDKIFTLIDLPGYKKYTKTTLFGLSTYFPDIICYVISIEEDIEQIKKDIQLYIQLDKPLFIILSKIDLVDKESTDLNNKINELTIIIEKYTNRDINYVEDKNDFEYENFEKNIQLFLISCVDNSGIDLILLYLSKLNNYNKNKDNILKEFVINDIFFDYDVGLIVSGIQVNGTLQLNDNLLIGCFKNDFIQLENKFKNILKYDDDITSEEKKELDTQDIEKHNTMLWQSCQIKSIHRKQVPFNKLKAGESATLVVSTANPLSITKNMIIIDKELRFNISNKFKIKMKNINDINKIKKNSNLTIHYLNMIQLVYVVDKKLDYLIVHFMKEPKYIRKNVLVIIRQNIDKYIGIIDDTVNFYF